MAIATSTPESSAMFIIRGMAIDTIRRLPNPLRHRRTMARRTFEPLVRPVQLEVCCDIMVESPNRPTVRVVALGALRSESLTMDVVGNVTRSARGVVSLERMIGMTRFTRGDRMKAQ